MDKFIEQHADRISGTLGCFDRMALRVAGAVVASAGANFLWRAFP